MAKIRLPESTDALMRRTAQGLVGWLTFQQAARRYRMYNEHFLYMPIFEMVVGRVWEVIPQFKLRDDRGRPGAPNSLDFVVYGKPGKHRGLGTAAVEVKYIRGSQDFNRFVAV